MAVSTSSLAQLTAKRRTVEDLTRFISEKITGAPNYNFLLGAGCSVSSGIRSGTQLIDYWREQVFTRLNPDIPYEPASAIKYLSEHESSWYSHASEYSCLFEKMYDLPRQRRMFVEKEVSGKDPNLGYAYLTKLVDHDYVNTIFTSNFDDLLNEAFFRFSATRPLVCAHDSSISSITITSKRPKIVKLHGDYLFDDIKATMPETESLEDNTKKKLVEFTKDFGLVVIGYNGCDRSIMDVLNYLLRTDDFLKNGIYWCIRKGDQPSDELFKLLWKDRAYFVEIDGFDELMASLHNDIVGPSLPIDTSFFTDKPRKIAQNFCDNPFLAQSKSSVVQRDLGKLRDYEEREHLLGALRDMSRDAPERGDSGRMVNELRESELAQVLEITQLISSGSLDRGRELIREAVATGPSGHFFEELAMLRARLEELAGDIPAAIVAVDDLIDHDPANMDAYIRKTYLVTDYYEKIGILSGAMSINSENYKIYARQLQCAIARFPIASARESEQLLNDIERNFDLSLTYEPGLQNYSWDAITSFYETARLPKEYFKKKCGELLERCGRLGKSSIEYLEALTVSLSRFEEDRSSVAANELTGRITTAASSRPRSFRDGYVWLELDALRKLRRTDALQRRIAELGADNQWSSKAGFLRRRADFAVSQYGDLAAAISDIKRAFLDDVRTSDVLRLAMLYNYLSEPREISALKEKYLATLSMPRRFRIDIFRAEAAGDYEDALASLKLKVAKHGESSDDAVAEVHYLLKLRRFEEAERLSRNLLQDRGWNKDSEGPLIVNFELAKSRLREKIDKKRISEVRDLSDDFEVKACCDFLLGDWNRAKGNLVSALKKDRENLFQFRTWAIFDSDDGRRVLQDAEHEVRETSGNVLA